MGRSRVARAVVGALVAVLVAVGATACEPPRQPAKDKPILFIHGWNAFGGGQDCNGNFGSLESSLRSAGFTGQMVTIGFYDSDTNCDVNLRDWGSGIDNGTSWKTLSQAFSKYIYETYTKKGQAVDLVGHSMGGLIARGAVKGSQAKESGFSAPLKVEDAVTLAAPHEGAAWYSNGCLWGQCSGLKPGSSELTWLKENGNPQGVDGTDWTVFGSTNDDVVPDSSALAMFVPDARKIRYSSLEHSDYMGNATCQTRVAKALAEVDA
ncbi:MAG: hypothetical protein R2701_09020 [Acidimicrobiales bacterium]|nr:hypothetical protein [Acidimicrobiales bacterium]